MSEKVTTMVLKVDLQCSSCYKKIKKILCKFPQIRDQIYHEKQNTVEIVVVCCSPEKIRDKLYCKGGKTIKCIEIKEPPKSKPPVPKPQPDQKPPAGEQKPPAPVPKPDQKPPAGEQKPPAPVSKPDQKPPAGEQKPPAPVPEEKPKKPPPCPPAFVPTFVPVCYPPMYPAGICCGQCYGGRTDGPCHHGHGCGPVPPCDNYGRGPCGCGCGGNRYCYTSRCDYFSEENPSGCTMM